ncbi:NADH dehydrogenase [ubiquinone] 1 beta subcomplex subunit 6 [Tachysurus fulvidraco]|uniref:NADH dehydrogenase [ubiquinone] 1 beta subcomplex subunit 6 n=1 Tax=Tachysurus fulvidraco TaxID=1234273 RepID=UPI000F4FA490|nr:NADH dehydrogenase [ubiquinone] 1 beta subcomplex subunit 6 [Tachysurus fulvidraco]
MEGYTAEEKLRLQQLASLRRRWLADQELSAREPVIKAASPGRLQAFWGSFLQPQSLWRIYTFKAFNVGSFALTRVLIPAWIVHYYVKYHLLKKPYSVVELKPRLFPGDTILETGEVVPELPHTHGHAHH